jgi:hypothetical protein
MSQAAGSVALRHEEPSQDQKRAQIARIVSSPLFCHAPLLKNFLQFVTSKAADGQTEEISEYLIATEVLGRSQDFDPASDTVVRTQAYRLRLKLKEYYETEGRTDPVLIEIPKGHYVPAFAVRLPESAGTERETPLRVSEALTDPGMPFAAPARLNVRRVSIAVGAVLAAFVLGTWVGVRWSAARVRPRAAATGSELVNTFWKGMFSKDDSIILAYTNSVFFETETGDLLRFRSGAVADRGAAVGREDSRASALNPKLAERAGPVYYEDGYTGTGEVLAVHDLTSLLATLGVNVVVKRSRLVTVDDLRNHDIIFLGSPFENQVLTEIRLPPQRFIFQPPTVAPYLWRGRIADTKSSPSGIPFYELERDPHTRVIQADYAIFDVLPGLAPSRRIVILAGLTTSGTQGAAEFSTSADGVRQILRSLAVQNGNSSVFPAYFECLLRVEAAKGLDAMNVKYVAGEAVRAQE